MIITLKGANFANSNIGTLSTWTISRVLGDGATYEGVTYVDKNAAFNATVTIAEGYEVGAAGVTVTMGGVGQVYTIDGNVITISIASVTGNVVIKVPTKNTTTGEEDGGNTGGNEDTGGGTLITSGSLAGAYLYEASGFNADKTYGIIDDAAYFVYDLIPVQAGKTYRLAYGRAVFFLNANKTAIGSRKNITSDYTNYTFTTPANCTYLSVAFKPTEVAPSAVVLEDKTPSLSVKSTTLLKDTTATSKEGYGWDNVSYAEKAAENFFYYKEVPVNPSTVYKVPYARSTWLLDASKNSLSRINISKDVADYTITTPANCAYISTCFSTNDVSIDNASIIEYELVNQ